MNMMTRLLVLALAMQGILRADEAQDFQPGDALYAPEGESGTAEASPDAGLNASYYSTCRISVVDLGHAGRPMQGVDLFIDGQFVGKSPLELSGFYINRPTLRLSAQMDGYHDAERPAVRIPPEGETRIVMVGDNAAGWYTTPSWVAGILLLGGAMAAYSQNRADSTAVGNAMIGSGLGVILLSQAWARLFHLPGLDREAARANARSEPLP
jgi:hypothetical protein